MDKNELKELNTRLVKWAGFIPIDPPEWSRSNILYLRWIYPDGSKHPVIISFISSLNAVFKWLVPKWIKSYRQSRGCDIPTAEVRLFQLWLKARDKHNQATFSESLCIAIDESTEDK